MKHKKDSAGPPIAVAVPEPEKSTGLLRIHDIVEDPNQPRKTFDDAAFQELVANVRQLGVLQPIGVRWIEKDKNYRVIFGARRLRAAAIICSEDETRDCIPAVIYNVSDEIATEMQLTENLMRENVHPMEEAVAFKRLLGNKTAEQIAAQIGKTPKFIKDRMRLTNLTPNFQLAVRRDLMEIEDALKVASLPEATQKEVEKDVNVKDSLKEGTKFSVWNIGKYFGILNNVPWSLTEDFPKLGPCVGCQFNSATGVLFENNGMVSKCSNASCYNKKYNETVKRSVKEAKKDPDIIFISTDYSADQEIKSVQERFGLDKIYASDKITTIPEPKFPDREEFEAEMNGTPADKKEKEWNKVMKRYENELQRFDELKGSGKFLRGLVVTGRDPGRNMLVSVTKASSKVSEIKQKAEEGKLSAADVDAEIDRLNEREKRNRELDTNNIHRTILAQMQEKKDKIIEGKPQNYDEAFLLHLLYMHLPAPVQDAVHKQLKKWPKLIGGRRYDPEYFVALTKLSRKEISTFVRVVAFERLGSMPGELQNNDTIMKLMALYSGIDVDKIYAEQAKKTEERNNRTKEKIKSLRETKKEIGKPKAKGKKEVAAIV